MKVYFYHTQNIQRILREWEQGIFPGHLLYGATHLERYGIDIIPHQSGHHPESRWRTCLHTTLQTLKHYRKYDSVYATSFRGLEIIIFLRSLGLFRKPIILWHHQAITTAKHPLRERIARIFYRGIDQMFFFSEKLLHDSLKSPKARRERMQVAPWGADLDFYNRLMDEEGIPVRKEYISTGKEHRDMPTLVSAFERTKSPLCIYLSHNHGGENYDSIMSGIHIPEHVKVNFVRGLIPRELAQKVWQAKCVVICCKQTDYTVGLTTLVEALALGIPVICSRNPNFAFDIDAEGVGITVPYYDVEGWERAIRYINTHPQETEIMGQKARSLAERIFNLERCAEEVARAILNYSPKNKSI
ncbi:MAG: glycosyltransferase family 1 protein [Paraprevotella sp.]|nr:glycosyltransferase family 1 protein [Paraprevotella sp.]